MFYAWSEPSAIEDEVLSTYYYIPTESRNSTGIIYSNRIDNITIFRIRDLLKVQVLKQPSLQFSFKISDKL